MEIQNTQECFVELWLRLERTRRLLGGQYKRFCIRRVLKTWFGHKANDDYIWEVCNMCDQEGWNELPPPTLAPRKHRELLRAIVAVHLGIGSCKVKLRALDAAYSIAFPNSTPINVNKKKPTPDPATVASGDLLPFVGPKPHSVASLKTPVAPREGRREAGVESSLQSKAASRAES